MSEIYAKSFDIRFMETLSRQDTIVHRFDPRSKILTTLIYIFCIVSFNPYEISALIPFFFYPIVLSILANLPVSYIIRKILIVSPFAFMMGIFNPFIDHEIILKIGTIGISAGWISFLSILIRFVLTVSSIIILIASTGFNTLCMALGRMGVPKIFTVQLLFLYRYIFVLIEEGVRMANARELRSFNGKGMEIKVFVLLSGNLLLRTIHRAQRIHLAMQCRGFNGEIQVSQTLKFDRNSFFFLFCWSIFFILIRAYNVPLLLEKILNF